MTKLEMAHEYAKELLKTTHANHGHLSEAEIENISETAFALAGAMQAEADKRSDMERPAVLQDEWQPDWGVAPDDATAWEYLGYGGARWHTTKDGFFKVAPVFGQPYYGDMIFIKRP